MIKATFLFYCDHCGKLCDRKKMEIHFFMDYSVTEEDTKLTRVISKTKPVLDELYICPACFKDWNPPALGVHVVDNVNTQEHLA